MASVLRREGFAFGEPLIDVEHGKRNIAFDNMMKIAGGLDITLSELVRDIERGT